MQEQWYSLRSSYPLLAFALFLALLYSTLYALSVTSLSDSVRTHSAAFAHPNVSYVDDGAVPARTPIACQNPNAPVRCYSPQQIRRAYSVQPLLDKGITGAGRTIVIVDAYQSPTIRSDLRRFDSLFGLPNPTFHIFAPFGLTPFNPNDTNQVGWAGEISLDVEWAHAIAPAATIDLVLATSSNDADIQNALAFAVNNNLGDVISQSFGEGEPCINPPSVRAAEHATYQQATDKNITLFASAGDTGAAEASQPGAPDGCNSKTAPPYFLDASTPASDPLVTGVGGTHLDATLAGGYIGESAWNDKYGASGGGYSKIYARPKYQKAVNDRKRRGVPDVAYNGDVNGGVLTVWSSYGPHATPHVFTFGGTSAGSPQWSGIIALADQSAGRRLGFLNNALYDIGKSDSYSQVFHDITSGNNTFTSGNITISGYDATQGWDAVTGWGTPIVSALVPRLINEIN